MRIRVAYHNLQPNGYGDIGKSLGTALQKAGYDAFLDTVGTSNQQPDVNLVCSIPESFAQSSVRGALNIGYTMCEAERIPDYWVRMCNAMDGILVPSTFCRDAFERSGVTVPVNVVYPCVEPSAFHGHASPRFSFLSVFQWGDRKDPETLLSAYWQEFQPDEPVLFLLKSWGFRGDREVTEGIAVIKRKLGLKNYAPLNILSSTLPRQGIQALHATSHCYVSAHHGEGWGLPIVDSMACGVPVIATGYSGNMDFMTESNSYPVAYRLVDAQVSQPWLRPIYQGTSWAQADLFDLRAKMRYVYEHRAEARVVGRRGQEETLRKFTTTNLAVMFDQALNRWSAAA